MKPQKQAPLREVFSQGEAIESALNSTMSDALNKSLSMIGKSVATLQKEGVRFMSQRIEENFKAVEEIGSCRSLPDLLTAQQNWLSDLAKSYSTEWQRCSEMLTDLMKENNEGQTERTRKSSGETPH